MSYPFSLLFFPSPLIPMFHVPCDDPPGQPSLIKIIPPLPPLNVYYGTVDGLTSKLVFMYVLCYDEMTFYSFSFPSSSNFFSFFVFTS